MAMFWYRFIDYGRRAFLAMLAGVVCVVGFFLIGLIEMLLRNSCEISWLHLGLHFYRLLP